MGGGMVDSDDDNDDEGLVVVDRDYKDDPAVLATVDHTFNAGRSPSGFSVAVVVVVVVVE